MRKDGERVFLEYCEALELLPKGEDIHVFMNPGGILIGADWGRDSVLTLLGKAAEIEVAGEMAQRMGHGLTCVDHDGRRIFVQSSNYEDLS